jgi:RimJ/RimL family protein N-acetyltransferase
MARLSDIPAIRNCYLRSWRAAYDGYLSPDVVDEEAEKRREFDWGRGIKADTSIVLVSVGDDGAVVGVVQVDEDLPPPRDRPEVVVLYLDPEAWGTQVARELLAAGLHWAADRGHSEVRLRVVEVHRRARRFYEREGWQVALELDADRNDFFRLIYYHRMLSP